jgi:hypothetical protein
MDTRAPSINTESRAELQQARKDINNAYQAGLFLGGINLAIFLAVVINPTLSQKIGGGWIFMDAVLFSVSQTHADCFREFFAYTYTFISIFNSVLLSRYRGNFKLSSLAGR